MIYENERTQVMKAGISMTKGNLVIGTWGNISIRIKGSNYFAITPSGLDYNTINEEGIIIMDTEGNIIDGDKKPSVEYIMHSEIYKNRQDVNAIVHTHSDFVTALAIARRGIPAAAEDMVQIAGGDIKVSEYALPGTLELGKNVVKALEGRTAAILANHGGIGAGRDLKETMKIVSLMEKSAKATIFANLLGGVVELSNDDIDKMRNFYLNVYSK